MKKAILSLAVMLGLVLTIYAQEVQVPKPFEVLSTEALDLVNANEEQKTQLTDHLKSVRQQIHTVLRDKSLSRQDKNKKRREIRLAAAQYLHTHILSPEQSKQLKAIQKEKRIERRKALQERKKQNQD
ncbi:hypothetical protein G5B30_14425 [Sphingobacterium sp. SGG-5]|uniref:hypothetical protein n=1 Tax=Sphingobacterium sp. SGG-5 TaxID=2710881 RepID=UPI0013EA8BDD|nr:hypothetical protein [Sphingobacterium sp. SGG-5]NGM63103.1 hypothetical protein [Sphingobacterium sp. SGG-5]